MRRWRDVLKRMMVLRELENETTVLLYWSLTLPSIQTWPSDVLAPLEMHDFYSICNGGFLLDYSWQPLDRIRTFTDYWIDLVGKNVLLRERHTAFATDSGGAPLVGDAATNQVATYWWKGGSWELLADSMEEFLTRLFNPAKVDYHAVLLEKFDEISTA